MLRGLRPSSISLRIRSVHSSAEKGFSAASASLYEKGRPEYSRESLEQISSIIGGGKSPPFRANLVELGAGTGKFTGCFTQYVDEQRSLPVGSYLATEPSDGFRATLQAKSIPNVRAVFGLGDSIPADSHSVDAVIVAQAFHWMDSVATLKEVHRVLKPTGHLILIWNTYDYRLQWLRKIDDTILTPAYGDTPRQQNRRWRNCFASEEGRQLFPNLSEWYHDTNQEGDREMVMSRIMSTSVIVERDEDFKAAARNAMDDILDNHQDLASARLSGHYAIPYVTHIVWAAPKH
eukprot:gene1642-1792_t